MFDSLDDFYIKIEDYKHHTDSSISNKLLSLSQIEEDNIVKRKLVIEQYAFDFSFREGNIHPRLSCPDETGQLITYPSFNDFDQEAYDYILTRLASVQSPYLTIRYSLLLWHCPLKAKKIQHAKKAIDISLALLKSFSDFKDDDECWSWYQATSNSVFLSVKLKYRVEEIHLTLTNLLFSRKLGYQYKYFYINTLTQHPIYVKNYFKDALSLLEKQAGTAKKNNDATTQRLALELGLSIASKMAIAVPTWNKRLGDYYVQAAEKRLDDESKMIPLMFYKQAVSYYKQAKIPRKVKEIELKYSALKPHLKLNQMYIPLGQELHDALAIEIKKKTELVLRKTTEHIYQLLSFDTEILPNLSSIKRMDFKDKFFTSFFTAVEFDINNNISKERTEDDKLSDAYNLHMRILTVPLLNNIFIEGIINGKIAYESLIAYFQKNTWLGMDFRENGTAHHSHNWIGLMAPSFYEYFIQTEAAVKGVGYSANYVLAIDSATIKFEGILRDLAKMADIPITKMDRKDLLREKYIEEILAEEKLRNYFTEDELFFFKNLFVSKSGYNLRNNIAHTYFRFQHYSIEHMHLLILAMLRVGKLKTKLRMKP